MRLYGFLTVSAVLSLLSTSTSGLPANPQVVSTSLVTIATSVEQHREYGRQASPDTSVSSSSEAAAEYTSPESSEEDCDCGESHSSILDATSTANLASASTAVSSPTAPSFAGYQYLPPLAGISTAPSITPSQTQRAQSTLQPQQVNLPDLGPTPYIGLPGLSPTIIPSTITPAAALASGDSKKDVKGQEWYQVTYWECVTWPSNYVHCGWHTPLRMGKNPDPNGETFIYSAGDRNGVEMGFLGALVGLTIVALAMF